MDLKNILFYGVLGLLIASCNQQQKTVDVQKRPNVILIMTDDQGYGDIAAHGNPIIKTPNLDALHDQSVRFTDFHVNPFCAPTRAALMTGRMSDRTHVRSTVYARNHLNLEETTMAEFFKASGYNTGHFGKWHLGQNYPYRSMDRGFDTWVGHGDGGTGSVSDYWGNDKMNDTYYRNGNLEKFEGYSNDVFFDETIKFINQNKQSPFFVYLATNVPHRPWHVEADDYKPYENIDTTKYKDWSIKRDFFATITHFDRNLGRLRKLLKDSGLEDNTIILFLTDNGTSGGNQIFNAGMRGKKGSMYDGGHRVPLFMYWPEGDFNKGQTIDDFTAHIDLLPTLINLCDLSPPQKGHLKFDGENLTALLKGTQENLPDRHLIMHQQNTKEIPVKGMNSLVATKQWRLINGKNLYDIKSDPGQTNNLADDHPQIVKKLNQKYDQHWDDLAMAKNPYPRPIVGSGYDQETVLVPDAWIRDEEKFNSWDQDHIVKGIEVSGFWPVHIALSGNYRFEISRWPREFNKAMNDFEVLPRSNPDIFREGKKVDDYGYGRNFFKPYEGKQAPIVKVGLEVDNMYSEKAISQTDTKVEFDLELSPGPVSIRAWLIDQENNKRGAYYIYIRKKE
jgi:arylsulfatase A-like enzyme